MTDGPRPAGSTGAQRPHPDRLLSSDPAQRRIATCRSREQFRPHRVPLDEAVETAADLAYHLPKRTARM